MGVAEVGAMHFKRFQGKERGRQSSKDMWGKIILVQKDQSPSIATNRGGSGKKSRKVENTISP